MSELPVEHFLSGAAWEAWLSANHASSPGVWLKIAKKGAASTSPSYSEALDVALCYGWIDGQKRSLDAEFFLQRFTRRARRSSWSKVNVEKVGALSAAGRMRPEGLAQAEAAKKDGRWDAAYPGQATMSVPPDFQAALDADLVAKAFFDASSRGNRYAMVFRVLEAKRPETRRARIERFVGMCRAGETVHGS